MRRTRLFQAALHNPSDGDDPGERTDRNLHNVLAVLDHATGYDPDVVVFPELVFHHAARGMCGEIAQPVPGPATDAVAEKAVALDSYVVVGLYERDGDAVYNSAAVIDPDGDVLGCIRKVAPTIGEMDAGITPASEMPTWDTPHGRLGGCICWDARYPEVGTRLGAQGVDLLVHPTHGNSDGSLRTWTTYNGYHVAVCDKDSARVYAPTGEERGSIRAGWKDHAVDGLVLDGAEALVSFTEINTDVRSYSRASATAWEWPAAVREAYPGAVVVHEARGDAITVVECVSEDLTLDDIEAEVEMETARVYEDRTRTRVHEEAAESPLYDLDG
jgi:hypothetical protein